VTLEVKPWDDETDMKALEDSVRSIEKDGLVWGSSKLVAVGYGIKKLQITLVVGALLWFRCIEALSLISTFPEDDKVSLDDLQEQIAEFEDYIQSTDVAAMSSTSVPL
jgi:elongation factor 1-beta